jgi:hypothetical protein
MLDFFKAKVNLFKWWLEYAFNWCIFH